MSRDRLWLALPFLLPALIATIVSMSATDLAYQVRAGDLTLGSLDVVRTDPFTFTAHGEPWLYQEWGTGVLFALVHGAAGWGGLAALRMLVIGAAVGLLAVGARRWLSSRAAALLAVAGYIVGLATVSMGAQLLGLLLFASFQAILAWRDRRPGFVWMIPVLMLVWANVHESFFLGPAAVAVALADDALARRPGTRRLAAVLLLATVASCVTPFGPAVWGHALGLATNAELPRFFAGWQRTSPFTVVGLLFYASLVGACLIVWRTWSRETRPSWPALAWLAGLAFLGVYAERGIAWWAIGAPVALASTVGVALVSATAAIDPSPRSLPPGLRDLDRSDGDAAPAGRRESRRLRRLHLGAVLVIAAVILGLQPLWRGGDDANGPDGLLREAPAGIAGALVARAGPTDRAVVPHLWASWFEWAAPGVRVMVDSRVAVVPPTAWEDYATIVAGGPLALETLDRIAASVVVVDPEWQSALGIALRRVGSGWRLAYEDDDGGLFVREP